MDKRINKNKVNDELIIKLLQGRLTSGEIKELSAWISSSDENRKYFEEVRNIWLGAGQKIRDKRFSPESGWEKLKRKIHQPSVMELYQERHKGEERIRRFIRMAAVFLVIFSLGAAVSWYVLSNTGIITATQKVEILAPQGSKSRITLPDGSMVWLNAGSKLRYDNDFNRSERIIKLEGEAYFNVRSNRKKPFVVQTSHLDVKAYGTIFNVKAYLEEDEIVTTLVEGNVVVENNDGSTKRFTYKLEPRQNITYSKSSKNLASSADAEEENKKKQGQQETKSGQEQVKKVVKVEQHVNTDLYTSWKDDNWVIEGVSLNNFARMLERRYNTKIEFESESIKKYRFSGTIRNETLEQVLEILRMTAPVKYEVGKGWVRWDLDKDLERRYDEILNQN